MGDPTMTTRLKGAASAAPLGSRAVRMIGFARARRSALRALRLWPNSFRSFPSG